MPSISLPYIQNHPAPQSEDSSDQYPSALPHHFIETFTQKGQSVFDPFMGFGTTAFVAESLGRVPFGVEADGERYEWGAGQLTHWQNIRHGDAADIGDFDFAAMDFCITSPPWMPSHEAWNPLYGGDPDYAGYDVYLKRMEEIFNAVHCVMKPDATVIVHVSDFDDVEGFTPLVRDMRAAVSSSFQCTQDVTIAWDSNQPETHCLMFKA